MLKVFLIAVVVYSSVIIPCSAQKDVKQETFWPNGNKKIEGYLDKRGYREGQWLEWYEDGKEKSEENYKHGKKDGRFAEWYRNGQIHKEIIYQSAPGSVSDITNGRYSEYYENGQKNDGRRLFEGS